MCWHSSYAQQDPVMSHFMLNQQTYNPAYAGTSGLVCASMVNRQQWAGFEGAPVSTWFHINSPLTLFDIPSGVGLSIMSDNLGNDKNLSINLSYAYHLDLGLGTLSLGLSGGMFNKALDPNWIIPSSDNHVPANNDPLIPENKESRIAFDLGFGAYYVSDNLFGGLSVTHLNEATIQYEKGQPFLKRHYYGIAGYRIQLPNPAFELTPSVFLYSDGRVSQFSVNTNVTYNKKLWGGVSYRAGDALAGMVGVELYNGIRISYAYDFPLSDIRKNTSGSHEFMVNYCFNLSLGRSAMRYKSIRFL